MAEAMFNRRLFNLEAEGAATIAADAEIPLPTDFAALKTVWLDTDPRPLLQPMTQDDLIRYWGSAATGLPQNYAFASDGIPPGPAPASDYRSDERRVGKGLVGTVGARGSPDK